MKSTFSVLLFLFSSFSAQAAQLQLVATTPDIEALIHSLYPEAQISTLTEGKQNPHHLDVKPSHLVLMKNASVIFAVGLGFEEWLPKLNANRKSVVTLGPWMSPEKDLLSGDKNHSAGNPHTFLDPLRLKDVVKPLSVELIKFYPEQKSLIEKNATLLEIELSKVNERLKERLLPLKHKKVVTYHTSFHYFLKRFDIENLAVLETHPGQPPTPSHLSEVIEVMKKNHVDTLLIESIYPLKNLESLKSRAPQVKVVVLPAGLGAEENLKTFSALFDRLANALLLP